LAQNRNREVTMFKGMRSVVVAFTLVVATQAPAFAQAWRVGNFGPPNGGLLVYRNIGQTPSCASYNGRDCLWGVRKDQIDFRRVRPLVCGEDHRNKWGVTGFDVPGHWCKLAKGVVMDDNH
jgi:hypothetical protein